MERWNNSPAVPKPEPRTWRRQHSHSEAPGGESERVSSRDDLARPSDDDDVIVRAEAGARPCGQRQVQGEVRGPAKTARFPLSRCFPLFRP